MEALESFNVEGFEVEIHHDESPESPREWCNMGIIVAWHRNYTLGDDGTAADFPDAESFEEYRKATPMVCLPVYMYDHSGIGLSTGNVAYPFNCPWDSGQLGWIYATLESLRTEYHCKRITAKVRAKAVAVLKSEVKEYGRYCNGEVYGYVVTDPDGESDDSCWGFIGFEYAESEGKAAAQWAANRWRVDAIASGCKAAMDGLRAAILSAMATARAFEVSRSNVFEESRP